MANLEEIKSKQEEDIDLYQYTIKNVDINLVAIKADKENLIKQLSARKAAEKAEQMNVEEVEENNTEKVADEIQQEEIVNEDNDNLNK